MPPHFHDTDQFQVFSFQEVGPEFDVCQRSQVVDDDLIEAVNIRIALGIGRAHRIKIERIGNHWGSWGDVIDIGMRRTQIRNTDGVIVNYPNSILANSVIGMMPGMTGTLRPAASQSSRKRKKDSLT